MSKIILQTILACALISVVSTAWAAPQNQTGQDRSQASGDGVWTEIAESSLVAQEDAERTIIPDEYKTFRLNKTALQSVLERAPQEFSDAARQRQTLLSVPLPDGTFARFRIVESSVLAPELAAKYPDIKSYQGQGIDDPTATVRFDLSVYGFRAIIISAAGTVYIEPYAPGNTADYVSFDKSRVRETGDFKCLFNDDRTPIEPLELNAFSDNLVINGASLRVYRLALAATGEYVNKFRQAGDSDQQAKTRALAQMNTTMNRVNGVYERELSIRMVLVANTDLLIYTDPATDPYNNDDESEMLDQNQATINSVIGPANYDIGHVFGTGGGGVAYLGSSCRSFKAGGVTGLSNPVGDLFAIDYVAHEMGHQFGAEHTFNGTSGSCGGGNRAASAAYEPGSGSTIMGYAGICSPQNLQRTSNDYFHVKSLEEILAYAAGGGACSNNSATGNTPPAVAAAGGVTTYNVPRQTPFTLTATASDPNNDALTYAWEEYDRGAASTTQLNSDADGIARPIFRSYNPTVNPSRTFPSLQYILSNANVPPTTYSCSNFTCIVGEILPSISRTMNFQVTVRDNRSGGGAVNTASVQVVVNGTSDPFRVTAPNSNVSWDAGSAQTVAWNQSNTASAPINATAVRILLSTDGGLTFPIVLADNTPNDGSETIVAPNLATAAARIKVEAVGNIFFDITDANFTISQSANCTYSISPTAGIVPATASTGNSFNVTTQAGCAWTATSNVSWITVTAGTGSGNGTVTFSVAANTGDARSGTITVAGQSFSVNQIAGNAPPGGAGLQYYPLPAPIRLLDTRAGQPACFAPAQMIAADSTRTQTATGNCGGATIPATAQAVVGTATAVDTVNPGHLRIYPSGAARPNVSNVNFTPGRAVSNQFTVKLGTNGAFDIYAASAANVVIDIAGYYAAPGAGGLYYHPLPVPVRLLETRPGFNGFQTLNAPLAANSTRLQQARITYNGVTVPAAATAIVGNATVVNETGNAAAGNAALYPGDVSRPLASNVNYVPGQTIPNAFVTRLDGAGQFNIYTTGETHFIVDVTGYYSTEQFDQNGEGLLFTLLPTPLRLLDTRAGESACDAPGALLAAGSIRLQQVRGRECFGQTVPAAAKAVSGNATVVNNYFAGASFGHIRMYPGEAQLPDVSNLNYVAGDTVPNAFIVGLGNTNGAINVYTTTATHLIIDVSGYFAP